MDHIVIFFEIFIINLLLSGDNAIVIAMVSNQLPEQQKKLATWWGAIIAVFLRCVLIVIAMPLLGIPYLQALGGLLLLYIAVKLLADMQNTHQVDISLKKLTLSSAIWTIITADFIMSLDNVLAIAAIAQGDIFLIMLGILMSIPMIIWGSQLLDSLLKKFKAFAYIGSSLLALAAGEMLIKDKAMIDLFFNKHDYLVELIPLLCIPIVIVAAALNKKAL